MKEAQLSPILNCMLIDDSIPSIRNFQKLFREFPQLNLRAILTSSRPAAWFLENEKIDLLFLTIEEHCLENLEFAQDLANPPVTIILSDSTDYAFQGFELDAVDYLLKPCLLYTSPSPRDRTRSRMPSSA